MTNIFKFLGIDGDTFFFLLLLFTTLGSFFARSASGAIDSRLVSFLGTFSNESFHECGTKLRNIWFIQQLNNTSFLNNSIRFIRTLLFKVGIHDFAMLIVTNHVH